MIEAVQAQGIRFFTLADAGNTEANQRKLYELNKRFFFRATQHQSDPWHRLHPKKQNFLPHSIRQEAEANQD